MDDVLVYNTPRHLYHVAVDAVRTAQELGVDKYNTILFECYKVRVRRFKKYIRVTVSDIA